MALLPLHSVIVESFPHKYITMPGNLLLMRHPVLVDNTNEPSCVCVSPHLSPAADKQTPLSRTHQRSRENFPTPIIVHVWVKIELATCADRNSSPKARMLINNAESSRSKNFNLNSYMLNYTVIIFSKPLSIDVRRVHERF